MTNKTSYDISESFYKRLLLKKITAYNKNLLKLPSMHTKYHIFQSSDLVNAKGSEMDKIQEMIKQSTRDFDPSK